MRRIYRTIVAVSITLSLLFSVDVSPAANIGDDLDRKMEKVRNLFENNMYVAVQQEIALIRTEFRGLDLLDEAELEGYALLCDILLQRPNTDALILEYENRFKNTPELAKAKFLQSCRYFREKNYVRAMEIMDRIEYSFLSRDEKLEYLFNRSYSQLRLGKITESRSGFSELHGMKRNPFSVPSTYYLAYITYLNNEFEEGIRLFNRIVNDPYFGKLARYYLLESHLILKDYDYVIRHSEEVSRAVDPAMRSQVARIVSDAYFELDRPEEAKRWFDAYSDSGTELSRKDNYYLGVISYSLESYRTAIDAFSKVISDNDSLTQSALYHTGNAYLNLKNKHSAYNAFKSACRMPFDENIREEAFFNYAKLSFDINDDIRAFEEYLEVYPASERADEIHAYIATSFLVSKQYGNAIVVLDKIRHPSPQIQLNLQKAAFFRGMELLRRGAYTDASAAFDISLANSGYNSTLMVLTRFWQAEAKYRTDHFQEALKLQLSIVDHPRFRTAKEYPLLLFNLGYTCYRLSDYENAIRYFNRFVEQRYTDMNLILEAKIRMADAYFIQKDYRKSSSLYEEVSIVNYDSQTIVYAAYQCAVSYGLLGNFNKKRQILESIYNKYESSPLYSSAVYELGRTYVQEEDHERAETLFKYLLEEINDPVYNSKSMLELGMLYSNQERYDDALDVLKGLVEQMPLSADRPNALAVIESVYALQNRPEEYLAYIDRIGLSDTKSANEREIMMFNAAEQIFLSGKVEKANRALASFIEKYPSGEKVTLAYFYLGETLLKLGKKEAAAEAYLKVMETGEGSFTELSTLNYADICYGMEQYGKALEAYRSLLSIAQHENNRHLARLGIMRSCYHAGQHEKAVEAANTLLATSEGKEQNRLEADYIIAKSYIATGKREEALPILRTLSKYNLTEEGAEATYLLIMNTYDSGDFTEVENMVYAFSDSESDQTYWLARCFIVLGDSFAERGEWEQAEATFKSIREGYEPSRIKDDILEQVELRMTKLKTAREADTLSQAGVGTETVN